MLVYLQLGKTSADFDSSCQAVILKAIPRESSLPCFQNVPKMFIYTYFTHLHNPNPSLVSILCFSFGRLRKLFLQEVLEQYGAHNVTEFLI